MSALSSNVFGTPRHALRKSANLVGEEYVPVSPFPSIVEAGSQRPAAVKGAPTGAAKLPLTARTDARQSPRGRKGLVLFLAPRQNPNATNQCPTNQGSLAISFKSGTQSDPSISSVARAIMIPSSNSSPSRGAGRLIITSVIYRTP